MTVKLHNTLTRATEDLSPLVPGSVSIYSCGPTVYDHVHIGNLSAFITADILRRTIAASGLDVNHVMNFTDVDDKTIRRSREEYPDMDEMSALRTLTEKYGARFLEDMERVGNDTSALTFIKAADEPTIEGMRVLIASLYEQGFAYIAEDGVYFSIDAYRSSGKTYGQLVEITDLSINKERIQNDEYDKEAAHDFALWKTKKPGEPAWNFTLNGIDLTGRPGWHIECSVMSKLGLGQPFDIHTGGIDLAFPHHENEIAQSTAGQDNPVYSSIFVHNEHILVDGKKMAKSAHNFYTLSDLVEQGIDPLAFRLLVLQSHYRKQTNFSFENVSAAHNRLLHWRAVATLRWQTAEVDSEAQKDAVDTYITNISSALNEDLDTPSALQIIDEALSHFETIGLNELSSQSLTQLFGEIDNLLGLKLLHSTPDIPEDIKKILASRELSRKEGDWNTSDNLRDELLARGIAVRDTTTGSVWSYS